MNIQMLMSEYQRKKVKDQVKKSQLFTLYVYMHITILNSPISIIIKKRNTRMLVCNENQLKRREKN